MTNTRITDPEVLESRFPVRLASSSRCAAARAARGAGAAATASCASSSCSRRCPSRSSPSAACVAPFGLAGGPPGARGRNLWNGRDVGGKASFEAPRAIASASRHRAAAATARLGCARAAPLAASLGTALARPGPATLDRWAVRDSSCTRPTACAAGRAVVQLFGRLSSGEAFLVEDTRFRPYFFTHPEATRLLADERDVEIEPSELVDLAGAPLVRVVRAGAAWRCRACATS